MGKWAKSLFGRDKFDRVGLVLAGIMNPEFERKVLALFDRVVSSKDHAYHAHLVKKSGNYYPILSNVYGGPAILDALTEMHDGGCRNVIFVGYAYGGFKINLNVGSIVSPTKSYHFDGIYSPLDPSKTIASPNRDLRQKVKDILDGYGIGYTEGRNISVPAVTFQLPHTNERYERIKPLTVEMELAACLSRSRDIGIRAAAILIISDNRVSAIGDETKDKLKTNTKFNVLKCLVKNLEKFDLPNLKTKREFNIDEHLASIIESPRDVTNVYRKK